MKQSKHSILVTGIRKGLGKYLYDAIGHEGLSRETTPQEYEKILRNGADTIIHCAYNSQAFISTNAILPYFQDNVHLTQEIVKIPHKKFIYLSSIDIYPQKNRLHTEDEETNPNDVRGIYGLCKLISESFIEQTCKNYVILRGSAFLGNYTKLNSAQKIIENKPCKLTLARNSIFNYIRHANILEFIKCVIENDLRGIYNVVSTGNITLGEIADMYHSDKVEFGDFTYNAGTISNKKIVEACPIFAQSSYECVRRYVEEDRKFLTVKNHA